jgi:hypothetical protein
MNTRYARAVLEALNPTISFQVGDVVRMPCVYIDDAAVSLELSMRNTWQSVSVMN